MPFSAKMTKVVYVVDATNQPFPGWAEHGLSKDLWCISAQKKLRSVFFPHHFSTQRNILYVYGVSWRLWNLQKGDLLCWRDAQDLDIDISRWLASLDRIQTRGNWQTRGTCECIKSNPSRNQSRSPCLALRMRCLLAFPSSFFFSFCSSSSPALST